MNTPVQVLVPIASAVLVAGLPTSGIRRRSQAEARIVALGAPCPSERR